MEAKKTTESASPLKHSLITDLNWTPLLSDRGLRLNESDIRLYHQVVAAFLERNATGMADMQKSMVAMLAAHARLAIRLQEEVDNLEQQVIDLKELLDNAQT